VALQRLALLGCYTSAPPGAQRGSLSATANLLHQLGSLGWRLLRKPEIGRLKRLPDLAMPTERMAEYFLPALLRLPQALHQLKHPRRRISSGSNRK